jgi:hypothetical protein
LLLLNQKEMAITHHEAELPAAPLPEGDLAADGAQVVRLPTEFQETATRERLVREGTDRMLGHFSLLDIESQPNRTGLSPEDAPPHVTKAIIGQIFAEGGGGMELRGAESQNEPVSYVFKTPNSMQAFIQWLDDLEEAKGIVLRLYPKRDSDYKKNDPFEYLLHSPQGYVVFRSIVTGHSVPERAFDNLEEEAGLLYEAADYMIEQRDAEGWEPAI